MFRLLLILSVAMPSVVLADVVVLRSGGRLEGRVRPPADAKGYYLIELKGTGALLGIPPGEVDRVLSDSDPKLKEYQQRLAAAGDDAEQHWQLARWCKANQMPRHWQRHAEAAIRLDPDHQVARAALDYVREGDRWVPRDQLQQSRGLVRYRGQWRLPEDVALVQAAEETEVAIKRWKKDLAQLLRGTRGREAAQALAEIQAIDDPMAVPAIVDALTDRKRPSTENLRSIYVELLGKIGGPGAVAGLIQVGMDEPVRAIRERAIDLVAELAPTQALHAYTGYLKSNDNKVVRKAGEALAQLRDDRAMLPLIEALVTEHKSIQGPPPGRMNVGFGDNGGAGGMQMGGKPKVVIRPYQNQEVLTALMELEPGVSYHFDEAQWLRWYAEREARYPYDLRRDP